MRARPQDFVMFGMEDECPIPDCPNEGQSHEHFTWVVEEAKNRGA